MADTKHTPRPRACRACAQVGTNDHTVGAHSPACDERRARAEAAAPELLAALRALLDMPMIVCVPPIPGPTAFTTIDKARALLARVEGGAK